MVAWSQSFNITDFGRQHRSSDQNHKYQLKKEIEESPPLDSDAPVSRQYEVVFNKHYDWVNYWGGASLWGTDIYPRTLELKKELCEIEEISEEETNLRSTEEVTRYRIHTRDDDIGHIEDLLVVEDTWLIRYLVIDTSNWIPGSKRVIVDPNWVDDVSTGPTILFS